MRKVKRRPKYGYIVALSIVFPHRYGQVLPDINIFNLSTIFSYTAFPAPVFRILCHRIWRRQFRMPYCISLFPNYILMNYRQQGWAFF